jgi:hypothetical protein
MPYPAVPGRKMALSLDGSLVGFNNSASNVGLATVFGSTDMAQLDGESPAKDSNTAFPANSISSANFLYVLFPELRDISTFFLRFSSNGGGTITVSVQVSADTTNGADGTWTSLTFTGVGVQAGIVGDWWRSITWPVITAGQTGSIKAIRFQVNNTNSQAFLRQVHIFGKKSTGQAADDVIFLGTDQVNELTADLDLGDLQAASGPYDTTIAVKNVSSFKTANSVVLDFQGSYTGDFQVSIDGGSTFGSTKTITSMAPAAIQPIVIRNTPPSASGGNYIPRAANLRAVVTSWS